METEGLGHQVVGSEIEAADARVHLLPGGENENRQVSVERANLFKDLLAVLDGHVEIKNGQVGQILAKRFHSSSAIMGQANAMSISLQTPAQKQSQRLVVFGDQ